MGNMFYDNYQLFGYSEPPYAKNYTAPSLLISWIRWHGPYNTFEEWTDEAKKYEYNERVRLYMALGKKDYWSFFRRPRVQYIGLNARDPAQTLEMEIRNKRSLGKKFGVMFNEYWVGELLCDWEKTFQVTETQDGCTGESLEIDTPYKGLTKNSEKSLIYSLKPEQDDRDQYSRPHFSFRIINQVCADKKHNRRLIKRFKKLVPDYIEYNRSESEQSDEIKKFELVFSEWR